MTRYDIETYYRAIGKFTNLLVISSRDRIDDIVAGLKSKLAEGLDTIYVEVTHNATSIHSYNVVITLNNLCDVYQDKTRILNSKTILEVASYISQQMPDIAESPYHHYVSTINDDETIVVHNIDTEDEEIIAISDITAESLNDKKILGISAGSDGTIQIHHVNHLSETDLAELLHLTDYIKDESLQLYARTCLHLVPEYVLTAPSNYDGARYQADNIAVGGLQRRIIHTVEMMRVLTTQDYAHIMYTDREIDMMIIACIFCDAWHCGWQEDYESDPSVRFEHPRIAANALRSVTGIISAGTIKFITNCIESHMGQQNKSPYDDIDDLPIPDTKFKFAVCLANYITKQRNVAIRTDHSWYHYDDESVVAITRCVELSQEDIMSLTNAMSEHPSKEKAIELGIPETKENEIKNIWQKILDNKAATQNDIKYIALAKDTIMF